MHRCIQVLPGPGLMAQTATVFVSSGETVLLQVCCVLVYCLVRPGSPECALLHPCAVRPEPALTTLSVHHCIHVLPGPGPLTQSATAFVSFGETLLLPARVLVSFLSS